jgi:anti-anti-sigma factor
MASQKPVVSVSRSARRSFKRRSRRRAVVRLRGEHDLTTVAALAKTLTEVIAFDHRDVVVDLSEVEFMGLATVDVLLRARALLALESRFLVLRSPSPPARRLLTLCSELGLLGLSVIESAGTEGTAVLHDGPVEPEFVASVTPAIRAG